METYFIRHTYKIWIDKATRENLWKKSLIALHFPRHGSDPNNEDLPDNESIDPLKYPGHPHSARENMKRLVQLGNEGGYVCAVYSNGYSQKCLVGKVEKGTQVQIETGKWWNMDEDKYMEKEAKLKVFPLQRVTEIQPKFQPAILAGVPRMGTILHWKQIKNRIKEIVNEGKLSKICENLFPSQLETLCAEYLRFNHSIDTIKLPILSSLLLPVGRTLKTVDIYGFSTDNKHIFAQVTNYDTNGEDDKFKFFDDYTGSDVHKLYFCSHDKIEVKNNVILIPIKDVFSFFESNHKELINALFPTFGPDDCES